MRLCWGLRCGERNRENGSSTYVSAIHSTFMFCAFDAGYSCSDVSLNRNLSCNPAPMFLAGCFFFSSHIPRASCSTRRMCLCISSGLGPIDMLTHPAAAARAAVATGVRDKIDTHVSETWKRASLSYIAAHPPADLTKKKERASGS